MALINIGKINKKIFIPIFGGLFRIIYKFIISFSSKAELLNKNPFLFSLYISIGMILALIPYLILKRQIKKEKFNINENSTSGKDTKNRLAIKYEHYNIYKKTKWSKYKFLFLASILDCLQTLCGCILYWDFVYNLWIFDIIIISLFSNLILKTVLYRHQYFSMIIIIILGLGLNIIEYFKKDKDDKNKVDLTKIIFKFISEIFLCLIFVIAKLNMEKYFCHPYEICIWGGFIDLILISISLLIVNKIGVTIEYINYPQNLYDYWDQFDKIDLFLALFTIIIYGLYNIFIIATCDIFSPFHVLITRIIIESYDYFKFKENLMLNILGLFCLILIFFMFLFFIEIFELNLFALSENTKKNIQIRSDSENENDNDKETESEYELNME